MSTSILLVPTDLSSNSRAGARFAIQLAKQGGFSLVFYHSLSLMKPTRWNEATYSAYVARQIAEVEVRLDKFIGDVYRDAGFRKTRVSAVVRQDADIDQGIVAYARRIRAKAICLSSRGAGRLKKLVGTHASSLIHSSPLPVFVIPRSYRIGPVKHILYASDLNAIRPELRKVRQFAELLKAKITVCHYDYLADVDEARRKVERVAARITERGVEFRLRKFNIEKSLGQHLVADMRSVNASLAALFTDQKRGWFDRLFLSSRTESVAFDSKIPILVFPK